MFTRSNFPKRGERATRWQQTLLLATPSVIARLATARACEAAKQWPQVLQLLRAMQIQRATRQTRQGPKFGESLVCWLDWVRLGWVGLVGW